MPKAKINVRNEEKKSRVKAVHTSSSRLEMDLFISYVKIFALQAFIKASD